MTEQHPEMDPQATFRLDQENAAAETEFWDGVRRVEATTTLEQRQALTKRVQAQASLLTTLDALVWIAVVAAAIYGLVLLVKDLL